MQRLLLDAEDMSVGEMKRLARQGPNSERLHAL